MSLTFNMIGSSGSGLKDTDAILTVTVPTGAVVTASKSNLYLSPTMWTKDSDSAFDYALFSVPENTFDSVAWTVTATFDGRTGSDTVVIDSPDKYDIDIHDIYIYHNGAYSVEAGSVVGKNTGSGTGSQSVSNSNNVLTLTNTYSSGNYQKTGLFYTSNTIDVTKFSKLKTTVSSVTGAFDSNSFPQVGVLTNLTAAWRPTIEWLAETDITSAISTSTTLTTDISSVTGNVYACFGCGNGSAVKTTTIKVTDWKLEI